MGNSWASVNKTLVPFSVVQLLMSNTDLPKTFTLKANNKIQIMWQILIIYNSSFCVFVADDPTTFSGDLIGCNSATVNLSGIKYSLATL